MFTNLQSLLYCIVSSNFELTVTCCLHAVANNINVGSRQYTKKNRKGSKQESGRMRDKKVDADAINRDLAKRCCERRGTGDFGRSEVTALRE